MRKVDTGRDLEACDNSTIDSKPTFGQMHEHVIQAR